MDIKKEMIKHFLEIKLIIYKRPPRHNNERCNTNGRLMATRGLNHRYGILLSLKRGTEVVLFDSSLNTVKFYC